jgi:hypothetical protein
MLCDAGLSAVLDTDKQTCMRAYMVACVRMNGMPAEHRLQNNHAHHCIHANDTCLPMEQQHRLSNNAYILDGVKGKDACRRVLCMAEHVRQGS